MRSSTPIFLHIGRFTFKRRFTAQIFLLPFQPYLFDWILLRARLAVYSSTVDKRPLAPKFLGYTTSGNHVILPLSSRLQSLVRVWTSKHLSCGKWFTAAFYTRRSIMLTMSIMLLHLFAIYWAQFWRSNISFGRIWAAWFESSCSNEKSKMAVPMCSLPNPTTVKFFMLITNFLWRSWLRLAAGTCHPFEIFWGI